MPTVSRAVLLWSLWIGAGLSLDLAAWLALRAIPVLAADPPGSAGAIVLILIHGFVLPSLFAGGDRWASRLLLGSSVALVAVPVALLLAVVTGFLVLDIPLMAIIALSPPQEDYVARQETGFLLRSVFGVLEGVMAVAPAAGGAVAALSAVGIAAAIPKLCRPRLSWRVALAGAWSATILLMPDWWTPWLSDAWRKPAVLVAAALPSLLLVSWRDMRGGRRLTNRGIRPIAIAGLLIAAIVFCPAADAAAAIDPRPDPDACSLLSSMDLEPLLLSGKGGVIDSVNGASAPGLATCDWVGRPQDHAADAVPRGVSLSFYHVADTTRARQQMDRQPHQDSRPSLAIGSEGDDAIVRPSPTVVVARHGADIAVIDASRADLAEPDQQETRYLLDALALKAAGAAVRSPPWVETGHVATMVPLALTGSISGWTPPPHTVPTGAAFLEPGIHILKALVALRVELTVVLTPVALALLIIPRSRRCARRFGGGLVVLLIATMLLGETAVIALVNRYGSTGAAIVTGSFSTSTQYNRHDVIGYRVLIATADRRVVASEFRTDDFDVRGLGDLSIYPATGDVFTVRYLPHHPQDFMIRNDDQSPWARKLACSRLGTWKADALQQASAAPGDASFGREAARATSTEQAAGCQ